MVLSCSAKKHCHGLMMAVFSMTDKTKKASLLDVFIYSNPKCGTNDTPDEIFNIFQ